ncbi:aminotransferase [Alloscardovia macacae]|uniref:alanine transaminase n=1 Tax=Alloscardovia macacae TaxID=1160091 RepID=A0A1Y2ST90_9BIFI|nr:pyridoxal phosphate-dependent aminotransferase [Alloscardovia macacae]OTA26158.1 aminotransferase [Alloscardovia macacae]OTA29992.1 aminotransferase [Alloscardovia macacae]
MDHFSHRTGDMTLNALTARSEQLAAQGFRVHALNDSNPTHAGLSVHGEDFRYAARARGSEESRRALASFLSVRYGRGVDAERLYLLDSTSQAYAWLTMLLCDAGDRVLFPQPGYPLIESICALTAAEAVPYRLRYDGSWTIDYADIEGQFSRYYATPHPVKAIVLINPNNPTQSYVKAEERARILDLCEKYGVAVIADEVFYDFPLDAFPGRARFVGESRVLTFALDGFSKMLGAPDVKVGWIYVSGPSAEVTEAQRRLDMIADDFLPMSSLVSREIPSLLQQADAQTARIRQRCAENLAWLQNYLASDTSGVVSVLRTEGGWSALLRYPASIDDDELGLALLEQAHAMSAPGYFFDFETPGYMAVSLLPESSSFRYMMEETLHVLESLLF